MILLLSFFALSLAWTFFAVCLLCLPDIADVPMDAWRLLYYLVLLADLCFFLVVKRFVEARKGVLR